MSAPESRLSWFGVAARAAALAALVFGLSLWMQAAHLRGLVRPDIPGLPQPALRDLVRVGLLDLAVRTAVRALLTGGVLAAVVLLLQPNLRRRMMTIWAAATLIVLGVMALTL